MKILLVDDSRAIAMVMSARLESFGHEVKHAASGELAVEYFHAGSFDLILMDIEMPGMNGFEATTRIRAAEGREPWAWTPIIFVTATDTATNLVTAIEAGGDDFISKSVPENVLQAKMKAMSRIAALRTRLHQANSRLQDQASHDGLTGLLNRRAMDVKVDIAWADALLTSKPFSLLMIDVDNFKTYNDHYGHQSGDECLKSVAKCLEQCVQKLNDDKTAPGSFVARYGGEEFAVILPDAPPGVHATVAAGLIEAVHARGIPHEKNGNFGVVTISLGAVCFDPAIGEIKVLFRLADKLLYKAKDAGRNRAEIA
jgi:diguanylate cyclase (GGDEF)-like protein